MLYISYRTDDSADIRDTSERYPSYTFTVILVVVACRSWYTTVGQIAPCTLFSTSHLHPETQRLKKNLRQCGAFYLSSC